MKPKLGQWVLYTMPTSVAYPALIVEAKPKSGDSVMYLENDWDVTLEVHHVVRQRDADGVQHVSIRPDIFSVERARFTTFRAGTADARGCWSWPPVE